MILDNNKQLFPNNPPPPPYTSTLSSFSETSNLPKIPPHILLSLIYFTFPQNPLPDEDKPERQRKTLYWICTSLRFVDRAFYLASMHLLRSIFLPAYASLVKLPYSSDPFPLLPPANTTTTTNHTDSTTSPDSGHSFLSQMQRETTILDRFIALKVREDLWSDASLLHLEREESFRDLFDLEQPRARLEDLVRAYGVLAGVVVVDKASSPFVPLTASSSSSSSSTKQLVQPNVQPRPQSQPQMGSSLFSSLFSKKQPVNNYKLTPPSSQSHSVAPPVSNDLGRIPFHLLSASFSTRHAGILLLPARRTIVSTTRARDEPLEPTARRLVEELRTWLGESIYELAK